MKEKSTILLADIKAVIAQYPGVKMTVRQVYYRLVAAQKIKNAQSEYNRVKRVLKDARLDGSVKFTDIEDRTRKVTVTDIYEETAASMFNRYYDYVKVLDQYYRLPRWWGQPIRPVVLVEKQALEGIFRKVCDRLKVDLLVCRGYPSITVLWELGNHLRGYECDQIDLLYFGDFDPSGKDIDRNVEERLTNDFGVVFNFERIAITREQIDDYNIPPAPAKTTDSRYNGFMDKEGVAWQVELDAFDPPELTKIIEAAIDARYDDAAADRRKIEVGIRSRKMKEWIAAAFNPGFVKPTDEDEDEDKDAGEQGGASEEQEEGSDDEGSDDDEAEDEGDDE